MSTDFEAINIYLRARDKDFIKAMERANRRVERFERRASRDLSRTSAHFDRLGSSVKGFAAGALGGLAAAGIAMFTTRLRGTVSAIASVGDAAKRAGVDVTAFQEWQYVAEANRIGVDALTDGLKELNLRADEFVVTGAGPAAEAFQRLGFGATDLAKRIKDPSALMLEITRRMEGLDTAARIRIADEVFGGTAGERFVELMGQGEARLRDLLGRAHEVGAVMDAEMIEKAAELDRRFSDLQTRVGGFFKRIVVGSVDAVLSLSDVREGVDDLFQALDPEKLLDGDALEALRGDPEATAAARSDLRDLEASYLATAEAARLTAAEMLETAATLRALDDPGAAQEIQDLAAEMLDLVHRFETGQTEGAAFIARLGEVEIEAGRATEGLRDIDAVMFSGVLGRLADLGGALASVARSALDAAEKVAAVSGAGTSVRDVGSFWDDPANEFLVNPGTGNAPMTSPRPRSAPPLLGEPPLSPGSSGSGGSSGGGAARIEAFRQAAAAARAEIAALEIEAAEFLAVADSGGDVAQAMDLARKRTDLLVAAQQDGLTITPELRAEIDELARAYVDAAQGAASAAEGLEAIQERAERVRATALELEQTFERFFADLIRRADSAGEVIAGLADRLADMALNAAFSGLFGGLFNGIAPLFTPARAGGGGVQAGRPYRVNEGTPNSEIFVPSMSGAILNTAQARDALRASAGGGGSAPVVLHYAPQIDARGADVAAVRRLEENQAALAKNFDGMVRAAVRTGQNRRAL